MTRRLLPGLLLAVAVACSHAPPPAAVPVAPPPSPFASDAEVREAASLITPEKVLQRIAVIADDSMGGRNTPSRGLELTARYLADSYQRWGLRPAGDSGAWLQRYTIERIRPSDESSFLSVTQGDVVQRFTFAEWGTAAGVMGGQPITAPVKLISGAVTADDIAPLKLGGMIVMFVQNSNRAAQNALVTRAITQQQPAAIVNVVNTGAAEFAARVLTANREGTARPLVPGVPVVGPLVLTVHDSLLSTLAHHPDFAAMRSSAHPVVLDLPRELQMTAQATPLVVSTASAPNVVAIMEGNDSVLKHEYVIFSGHMDHVGTAGDGVGGCTAKGADRICNGADDDGSGTTGVMSIAEAVAQLKGRTRRSIVILNVSGEEKGLLGSAYFTAHSTVPLANVVADINMDMIGRNNPDSIVVIGKEHSDMGATLAQVQSAHPELHLTAADDIWPQESFYTRSDHFNFARMGVPVLFFFNGTHPQYHQPDDEVKLIDTSKLSRVAQLAFYLGIAIADSPARPKWNPASYQTIVVEQKLPAVKP